MQSFRVKAAETAESDLDEVHEVMWQSLSHLFPPQALVRQIKPGCIAITWSMEGDPDAKSGFATPVILRIEKELIDLMGTFASLESRKRVARQQEANLRAGMKGYDPYASPPNARVIVLG